MSDVTGNRVPPGEPSDERSFLSGYLDDELSAAERALVEAQLEASGDWRAELEEVRVARAAVRGLAMRDAPPGFWDRITESVRATSVEAALDGAHAVEAVEPVDLSARRRTNRRAVAWAAGAVAVAASLVAMFVIPAREQVRPNVTAVVTQHAASSSDVDNPISGLVPLGSLRAPR